MGGGGSVLVLFCARLMAPRYSVDAPGLTLDSAHLHISQERV